MESVRVTSTAFQIPLLVQHNFELPEPVPNNLLWHIAHYIKNRSVTDVCGREAQTLAGAFAQVIIPSLPSA